MELHGVPLAQGSRLALVIASANRDPRQFSHPDELDITRSPNHHVGFGAGPHFCIGAPLARMEARQGLKALLSRYGNISLTDDPPEWTGSALFRGLTKLKIKVTV